LFCGGSIGREGPTVHVGAVIVNSVGRLMPGRRFPGQRHALVLAGGAAGVAAAFNTPLAGIVFAIEELSRSFEERASGTTLTTVILAGVAAIALVGDYTYFGLPQVTALASRVKPEVLVVAAAQHAMVLPLMLTAAVATAVSKMVSKPLYQTLADRYAAIPEPVDRA
jgi:H+/Cl- antiporter ClcA